MSDEANPNLFDEIVDALGGTGAAAKAIGRRSSEICQWRAKDQRFPAEVFWDLQAALKKRRKKRAPREVFRFQQRAAG